MKFRNLLAALVLSAALIGALVAPKPAEAQIGVPATLISTNAPAAAVAATNTVSATGADHVAFQMDATGTAASVTNAITFAVQQSLDGATFDTLGTLTITPTGTSAKTVLTNLSTKAAQTLRVIGPDNSGNATNCAVTLKVAKKPGI